MNGNTPEENELLVDAETVRTSIYLPRELHRQLKMRLLDMAMGTRMNSLIVEAIDQYLNRQPARRKNINSTFTESHQESVQTLVEMLNSNSPEVVSAFQTLLSAACDLIELKRTAENDKAINEAETTIRSADAILADAEDVIRENEPVRQHRPKTRSVA
jgi:hypothetical protein